MLVELNDRPRKKLNYKTSAKLMAEHRVGNDCLVTMHFKVSILPYYNQAFESYCVIVTEPPTTSKLF